MDVNEKIISQGILFRLFDKELGKKVRMNLKEAESLLIKMGKTIEFHKRKYEKNYKILLNIFLEKPSEIQKYSEEVLNMYDWNKISEEHPFIKIHLPAYLLKNINSALYPMADVGLFETFS